FGPSGESGGGTRRSRGDDFGTIERDPGACRAALPRRVGGARHRHHRCFGRRRPVEKRQRNSRQRPPGHIPGPPAPPPAPPIPPGSCSLEPASTPPLAQSALPVSRWYANTATFATPRWSDFFMSAISGMLVIGIAVRDGRVIAGVPKRREWRSVPRPPVRAST